jgi:oligopeptide transport system substrate-binding protein
MKCLKYFLLSLVFSAGCQKSDADKRKPDWLYINFGTEPTTHDGRKSTEIPTTFLYDLLSEGLMKMDPDGHIIPAQAQRLEISENGLTYTFFLKDNLWSNGESVTAQDFANSWLSCLNPQFPSPFAYHFYAIKNAREAKSGTIPLDQVGIEVVNSKCLRVHLSQPNSTFLTLICSTFARPIRYKTNDESHAKNLLCNGPFYIEQWKDEASPSFKKEHDKKILLKRNPFYANKDRISFSGIDISLIEDQNTAYELFRHQQLDFLGGPSSPISPTTLETLPENQLLESLPSISIAACNFNTTRFPLDNLNLRRALSAAIDRELLANSLKAQKLSPAYSIVPDGFKMRHYASFSPKTSKQAEEYFKEALSELNLSVETFPKLKLIYPNSKHNVLISQIVQIMQESWRNVLGIEIELESSELKSLVSRLGKRDYDLGLVNWDANYPHPISFLERFLTKANTKNYSGWESVEFQMAIEKAYRSLDPTEQMGHIMQAEEILADAIPAMPIVFTDCVILADKRLSGLKILKTGTFWLESLKIQSPEKKSPGE